MANNIAFQAQGKTYKANVTTGSQTITITADSPCNQLLVSNHQPTGATGFPVYFVVSSNASITVSLPVAGTPQYCLVSVPGTIKSFTIPQQFSSANTYIAFISEAASECYFTPGEGL
ncbi:hypothetical protein UFOVP513_31 [uncultured Caudovirales phage]|uniref:Uncharacterized protein n=1 Tax=uncultured Caudovirales phage TaxID=2100421 RepID=A0A6J5MPY1_9CAUD|nr:hypothetical protein UFOVP513_31 [uncultured Caudovirales phage]